MVERKTVVVFVDASGKEHETEKQALRAEAYNALSEALDAASAYRRMDIVEVPRFIDEHKELVLRYLESDPAGG